MSADGCDERTGSGNPSDCRGDCDVDLPSDWPLGSPSDWRWVWHFFR